MTEMLEVDIGTATTKQLLIHLIKSVQTLNTRIESLEMTMVDLTSDVVALKGAVDGVAQRLLPRLQASEAALVEVQAKLAEALGDDAAAAALMADAVAASAAIRTEVDRLNALGEDPTTPVDPAAPNVDVVPDVVVETDPSADAPVWPPVVPEEPVVDAPVEPTQQ